MIQRLPERGCFTVESVCCGNRFTVPESDMEEGIYSPSGLSPQVIECKECGALSRLMKPNRAAVERLNLRQLQEYSEASETSEGSNFFSD